MKAYDEMPFFVACQVKYVQSIKAFGIRNEKTFCDKQRGI